MSVWIVDFDDTIASGGWPDITKAILIPEAKKALQFMKSLGHKIIIWTCREGSLLNDALNFLKENDIPYDFANENDPERITCFGGDCRKVAGDYLIDDKCVGGIDWERVVTDTSVSYIREHVYPDGSNAYELSNYVARKYQEIYGGSNE